MANSLPSGIKIEYDNSGGSLVDISQYITDLGDYSVEQLLEEKHSFGDSWEEVLPVGIGKSMDIELTGLYDDTLTVSPYALVVGRIPEAPSANPRTLKITWIASGKNTSWETHLVGYKEKADRNGLTKFTFKLRTTGAVTEA